MMLYSALSLTFLQSFSTSERRGQGEGGGRLRDRERKGSWGGGDVGAYSIIKREREKRRRRRERWERGKEGRKELATFAQSWGFIWEVRELGGGKSYIARLEKLFLFFFLLWGGVRKKEDFFCCEEFDESCLCAEVRTYVWSRPYHL